jgi:hypothetical protein
MPGYTDKSRRYLRLADVQMHRAEAALGATLKSAQSEPDAYRMVLLTQSIQPATLIQINVAGYPGLILFITDAVITDEMIVAGSSNRDNHAERMGAEYRH